MTEVEILKEMVGRSFVSVTGAKGDEEMLFTDKDGRWVKFYYEHDCCASCNVEDICGDLSDLVGTPILHAEEVSNEPEPYAGSDSYTWTFYKFDTIKGSITVRWLGESNGYYSESVSVVTSEKPSRW
jgi:hypothetical protein